jgi:hypothetical protein
LAALLSAVATVQPAAQPATFTIFVQREKTVDGLVIGKLSANGEALGTCYENDRLKIPAGTYTAHLRYTSGKNHVTGPGGKLGTKGDFLVELDPLKQGDRTRTLIQFHAGNKAEHSEGCILCGAAVTAKNGDKLAPATLQKLRLAFYDGQDQPQGMPNKRIIVEIRDP